MTLISLLLILTRSPPSMPPLSVFDSTLHWLC